MKLELLRLKRAKELATLRNRRRESLLEFVTATMPDFQVSWHHRLLCKQLDRFARGESRRLMIFLPPRHSKCLPGWAAVLMADGSEKPIRDVRTADMVYSLDDAYNVTHSRVSSVASNGVKPVKQITLRSGRTVTATDNHPLLTVDGWKELGDIRPGESVAVLRQIPFPSTTEKVPVGFPALMGYITGDGSYGQGDPIITNDDPEVVEHIRGIAAHHGWVLYKHGVRSYHVRRAVDQVVTHPEMGRPNRAVGEQTSSAKLTEADVLSVIERLAAGEKASAIARSLGVGHVTIHHIRTGKTWSHVTGITGYVTRAGVETSAKRMLAKYMPPAKSRGKAVPPILFRVGRGDVCEFLAAYFNCDGWVSLKSRSHAGFCSTSRQLLEGVQCLLHRLGIQSSIREHCQTYKGNPYVSYKLNLEGEAIVRFAEMVPVIGDRGRCLRTLAERLSTQRHFPEYDAIPPGWKRKALRSMSWHRLNTGVRADKQYKCGTARHIVRAIAEAEGNAGILALCNDSIIWERVESVETAGDTETFDIEVEDTHCFFTGGVVVHNSQLVSRHLPAMLLGNNPDRNVIACSYSADLASRMNRDVQRIIDSDGYRSIFQGVRLAGPRVEGSKSHIRTSDLFEVVGHRGSYRSAGVSGGITGMGFDWGIIDDPVKNREEADSPALRDAVWEWFTSTFYTRRAPGAGILLTMTRWHPEDLAGRLLAQAEADPRADQWEVVRLPAIAGDDRHPEDPRQPGEALWPEFYPADDLEKVRAQSAYDWASMYQQEPRPEGGTEWPESHFGADLFFTDWPHPNQILARAIGLDPSKGKDAKHGDYAAFTLMALCRDGTLWVEADLHRGKPMEFLVDQGLEHCISFRPDVFAIEANMFQELAATQFRRRARELQLVVPVMTMTNTVNKNVRIRRLGPYLANRTFRFRATAGTRMLIKQLKDFAVGDFDDAPDSMELTLRALVNFWNGKAKRPQPGRVSPL